MKLLKIYEKAWIAAIVIAIFVAAFNFMKFQVVNQAVYFPIIIAFFCLVVYLTKKNHRKFLEKHKRKNQDSPV